MKYVLIVKSKNGSAVLSTPGGRHFAIIMCIVLSVIPSVPVAALPSDRDWETY